MPSVSKKQHNLMALVANDPKAAKRLGISQSVGRDFMKADKGREFRSNEMRDVKKFNKGSKGPVRGRGASPAPGSLASLARHPNQNTAINAWAKGQKTMFPIYQRTGFPSGRSGTESNYQYDPAYDPAFEQGYREFEQSERGLAKGGKAESKAMMRREVAFMKKKGAPKSMIRHEEAEMRGMKKGVKKMQSGGSTRGGPTTRVPTGPTAPRYGYIPNPFGQDIRYKKGPSGVSFPKKATTNPRDIFGNENPDFNQAMREFEEAERMRRESAPQLARGGKAHSKMKAPKKHRYAGGGMTYSGGGSVYRKGADGIATKGRTKGHMVKMRYGGKC